VKPVSSRSAEFRGQPPEGAGGLAPERPSAAADDDDLPPLPRAEPGRYRHYKGGEYELVGVARHSETLEPLVVYRPLYNATGLWVRPYDMFFGELEVDGVMRRRFARL